MSTYVHNLLQTTINELTKGASIIHALRQTYAIATSIQNKALAEWAEKELSGYPNKSHFPNPHGASAPKYRLTEYTVKATFVVKKGIKSTSQYVSFDLHELENANHLEPGTLSSYFIPNAIDALERHRSIGFCNLALPHLKNLAVAFFNNHTPGSTCRSFFAQHLASSFGSAAKGVRMEAIRRLMETGLGGEPLLNSALNIHMENSLKDQSTKVNAPGGQIGNIVTHSNLEGNHLPVTGQRLDATRRTGPFREEESKQFRQDVQAILHLLVERYEELDDTVTNSLQNTLRTLRAVEIQGKSIAELEDMLGDIWAKHEIASMRVPQFVEDAISATKVLKELGSKFAALTGGIPG